MIFWNSFLCKIFTFLRIWRRKSDLSLISLYKLIKFWKLNSKRDWNTDLKSVFGFSVTKVKLSAFFLLDFLGFSACNSLGKFFGLSFSFCFVFSFNFSFSVRASLICSFIFLICCFGFWNQSIDQILKIFQPRALRTFFRKISRSRAFF